MKTILFCLTIVISKSIYADPFNEFVYEVAAASGESETATRKTILETFKVIKKRMVDDKATSIPEFGRFYTHEREKKGDKDKDGYWLSPRMVRTPKFTIDRGFKKKLEKLD